MASPVELLRDLLPQAWAVSSMTGKSCSRPIAIIAPMSQANRAMRLVVSGRARERQAAARTTVGRSETEILPREMARWSLTSLRERLIKIGAKLVRHARRLVLQMAEVSITRALFGELLERIWGLSPVPT